MTEKAELNRRNVAKCEHDWMLFYNGLVAVRICRRCGLQEDAS